MANKISCDNCDKNVIVNGQQTMFYYEYDVLPFPVAGAAPDKRAIICALCDDKLRKQNGLAVRSRATRDVQRRS